MFQIFEYYGRYQGVKSQLTTLPGWARAVLLVAALPGIVVASLSILAFVVSLLALLVLTVPVYRLLRILTGARMGRKVRAEESAEFTNRRHVDVKIVE
jgi:hypothetical protein